eukprot:1159145-Pelagomonas_calceolata.AAC.33
MSNKLWKVPQDLHTVSSDKAYSYHASTLAMWKLAHLILIVEEPVLTHASGASSGACARARSSATRPRRASSRKSLNSPSLVARQLLNNQAKANKFPQRTQVKRDTYAKVGNASSSSLPQLAQKQKTGFRLNSASFRLHPASFGDTVSQLRWPARLRQGEIHVHLGTLYPTRA